jgi:CheY-like chemotaxis protein
MCTSRDCGPDHLGTLTRGVAGSGAGSSATTVLVVDDDQQIASLAGEYIGRVEMELTVVVETDPRDALARFEVGDVDCVVSDYEMPAMDGLELLGAVRESGSATPFVLFTARDDETLARRARERGAAYLHTDGPAGGFERLSERVADALADCDAD